MAQWLGHRISDQGVPGSNPGRCTFRCGLEQVTFTLLSTGRTQEAVDGRPTWTDCDEAGDYVVPNALSPRDPVFRPDNMDELYHTHIGCHGNHAFSHSPNMFIFRTFFHIQGVLGNNLASMKNCPGGARRVRLDTGPVQRHTEYIEFAVRI